MAKSTTAAAPMRERLQQAALEMFLERGFDRTTAADVAARAGVTERTFFRHFADKRETLFGGEAVLRSALLAALAEVPPEVAPLDALFAAFRAVVPLLLGNRGFSVPRQAVIAATPALQEREFAKLNALAETLAGTLAARGTEPRSAWLAAQVGMAAFANATIAWLDDPAPGLEERLEDDRRRLRDLLR